MKLLFYSYDTLVYDFDFEFNLNRVRILLMARLIIIDSQALNIPERNIISQYFVQFESESADLNFRPFIVSIVSTRICNFKKKLVRTCVSLLSFN